MKTPDSSLRARVSAREAIQNRTSSRLKRLHQRTFAQRRASARPAMTASTLMRLNIQKPLQQRVPIHFLVGQRHRQHLPAKNIG